MNYQTSSRNDAQKCSLGEFIARGLLPLEQRYLEKMMSVATPKQARYMEKEYSKLQAASSKARPFLFADELKRLPSPERTALNPINQAHFILNFWFGGCVKPTAAHWLQKGASTRDIIAKWGQSFGLTGPIDPYSMISVAHARHQKLHGLTMTIDDEVVSELQASVLRYEDLNLDYPFPSRPIYLELGKSRDGRSGYLPGLTRCGHQAIFEGAYVCTATDAELGKGLQIVLIGSPFGLGGKTTDMMHFSAFLSPRTSTPRIKSDVPDLVNSYFGIRDYGNSDFGEGPFNLLFKALLYAQKNHKAAINRPDKSNYLKGVGESLPMEVANANAMAMGLYDHLLFQ